uniref:Uncharacterized protein n=1 Tax=Cannabis sativa TaxID=3483 RepID=A0A803Q8V4_CANSA
MATPHSTSPFSHSLIVIHGSPRGKIMITPTQLLCNLKRRRRRRKRSTSSYFPSKPFSSRIQGSLRVPTTSKFKKNPFKISNSVPLEEIWTHGSSSNQGLQEAVNRFFPSSTTHMTNMFDQVTLGTAMESRETIISSTATECTQTQTSLIRAQNAVAQISSSRVMVTSVISHYNKGKGIATLDCPSVRPPVIPRPPTRGIHIRDPNPTPVAPTVGVKRPFVRQNV